ncbi:MAG: trigger factor [Candidatus Saccharibacteria bacterium]
MIKSTLKDNKTSATLTVTVDEAFIDPYKKSVLKRLKKDLKVDGFRPGHAPDNIVVRELGEARVQAEVLEEVIDHAYSNQMREQTVESLGSPEIDLKKFVPYSELEFSATFPIMSEIKFDYSKLSVKKPEIKIDEARIDEAIETLRSQMAKRSESKKPIKNGDEVRFDFEGKREGKPVEGAAAKNHTMIIGSKTFIPGFEEELIGLKKDEEKTFDITFPKDYHASDLKNAKVEFSVKINEITNAELPTVDDEFAKNVGNKKNIKELREDIGGVLKQQDEEQSKKDYENKILEEVLLKAKFDVPEQLINQQVAQLESEMDKNLHNAGMDRKKYQQAQKITEEDMKKEVEEEANKRVRAALILRDVIKKNNIKVSDMEMQQELAKMAEQYKGDPKIQEELTHGHFQDDLRNHLLTQKAIGQLIEFASK